METNNPYSSPESNLFGGTSGTSSDGVTQGVLLQLQKTKPWVRFMSVMMFILAGVMLLGGVFIGIAGGASAMSGNNKAMGAGFGIAIAAAYSLLAILYIFPALKLWKYANRIHDLLSSRQVIDLENALNEQRAFWKFVGVAMIVMLFIYIVGGIGVAVFAGIAAAKGTVPM